MAELIQIGNSKGVRIPKALIQQAGLENRELELRVTPQGLLIKPKKNIREGWAEAVQQALQKNELEPDRDWLDAELDSSLSDS